MSLAAVCLSEIEVAQMLPDVELPRQGGGPPVALRPARAVTTVILLRHPFACPECDSYLRDVEALEEEFRVWEARLLVLTSSSSPEMQVASFGTHAVDEHLPPEKAGVIVADRYGQVFHVVRTDCRHHFPSPRELTEWIKYLGTLCPE